MSYTYPYPRPALTVDAVVFRKTATGHQLLLIQRKHPPFQGKWALPGGFVDENESLEKAVARELEEETGLKGIALKQLHAFGDPGRDPRGHTVSVAFWGVLQDGQQAVAGDDARHLEWFPVDDLPPLAFDHQKIVEMALGKLKGT